MYFNDNISVTDAIFDSKTRLIAWFVSNCHTHSRRESYVRRMKKVTSVDVYGECGTMSCGSFPHVRSDDRDMCLPMLTDKYK